MIKGGGVDEAQVRCLPPDQLCPQQRRLELLPGWVCFPGQTGPGHGEVKGQLWKLLHQSLEAGQHRPPVLPLTALTMAQASLP